MIEQNWDNASWLGSRRAMIRHSLKLTIRQRLQALENLYITSQKIATLRYETSYWIPDRRVRG